MAANSKNRQKPRKPHPTFPLTPHPNGQWCKKIRGRVHFFGVWDDPVAALDHYNRQASDLHAGRQPRASSPSDVPTVKELGNTYLAVQAEKASRGLITASYFNYCKKAVKAFVRFVGKDRCWDDLRPADFGQYRMYLYDHYGVCAIDRAITVIRSMLKHAWENDLIDRPIKFAGQFEKPSAKERRRSRSQRDRQNGKRLFASTEVLTMLHHADAQMKAMVLLGVNGGFGNTDCATLPIGAVDLENDVIEYERPKSAIPRVVPLWPETVSALKTVLEGERPTPQRSEHQNLVFLTRFGNPWEQERIYDDAESGQELLKGTRQEAISPEFRKLLCRLGLHRDGIGFYALRHTFRTWADETKDQHAVHRIMGHVIPGMSGIYVEEISMERLRAVVDHVRSKLFTQ